MADDSPTTEADDRFGDWTDDNIVIVHPPARGGAPARADTEPFEFDPEKHPRDDRGRFGPGTVSADTGGSMTLPDDYGQTKGGLPVLPDTKAKPNMMTGPTPQRGTESEAAKEAFDAYQEMQGGTYKAINEPLRAGGPPNQDAVEMTEFIDRFHTVKDDVTVYRAVDASKFPVSEGMRWRDKGFTSADLGGSAAKEWPVENRALLAIHVPAGSRAMAINDPPVGASTVGTRELIIQRGSSFEVERNLPQTQNPRDRQAGDIYETGFPGGVWHVNLVDQRRKDLPSDWVGVGRRVTAAARRPDPHAERYYDWDVSNVVIEGAVTASGRPVLGLGPLA